LQKSPTKETYFLQKRPIFFETRHAICIERNASRLCKSRDLHFEKTRHATCDESPRNERSLLQKSPKKETYFPRLATCDERGDSRDLHERLAFRSMHSNGSFGWLICASRANESPRNERLATCDERLAVRRLVKKTSVRLVKETSVTCQRDPLFGSSQRSF